MLQAELQRAQELQDAVQQLRAKADEVGSGTPAPFAGLCMVHGIVAIFLVLVPGAGFWYFKQSKQRRARYTKYL